VALGALLLGWLNRGLDHEIERIVTELSPVGLFDSLYADLAATCAVIRRHADALASLDRDLQHLQEAIGQVDDLGLGSLRV
jgi:hypothetical protein